MILSSVVHRNSTDPTSLRTGGESGILTNGIINMDEFKITIKGF